MPRPRAACDTVATNYGGVAAVAFTGARLQPLDIGAKPTTFEFVCVRVTSGDVSYIVCAIYRPGSTTVSTTFFADLSDVLDRLATFVEPLFVVGDLNVHLEKTNDTSASQLVDLFADTVWYAASLCQPTTSAAYSTSSHLATICRSSEYIPILDLIG